MRYNIYKSIFNLIEILQSLKSDDVFVVHDSNEARIVGYFTTSANAIAFQEFMNSKKVAESSSMSDVINKI